MHICRNIEFSLVDDFLIPGKPLPSSFDEMPLVRQLMENSPSQIALINTLAIVPNTHEIESGQGILRDRWGRRLFAISRTWNYDYSKEGANKRSPMDGGRFAIMISPDQSSAAPSWIPEPEARLILQQVDGFDPAKQPLSFLDLAQAAAEKSRNQRDPRTQNWQEMPQTAGETNKWKTGGTENHPVITRETIRSGKYNRLIWVSGASILAGLIIYMVVRNRSRR